MPPQDQQTLLAKAEEIDRKRGGQGVFRFAEPISVHITPENAGIWNTLPNGNHRWQLRVTSEGAQSLNLGFSEYHMPEGGRLSIRASAQNIEKPYRDFTAADNEAHGQLWTPIFNGGEVTLEVEVPGSARDALGLALSKVNHGFRKALKIGGDTSGSCNIDVACTDDPNVGSMVQEFANEIRSVGAYTIGGTDTCSGALINNTRNDGTPYFLTAEHCGINDANAPSMVVYFNFQNSTCRPPDSTASGSVGDGSLTDFMSGATLKAVSAPSDFCLVELDDPVPTSYNVFFSGWDNSGAETTSATGIHHPAVAEKRISFDLDPTTTLSSTHVTVADWDFGTTEGGSSGSPLYDQNRRIIGDLTGGGAACGNDESDRYGALSVSWEGGGTPATRLRDWLDPLSIDTPTLDGINLDNVLQITDAQILETDDGTRNLDFTVSVIRTTDEVITVSYATSDGTAIAGEDFTPTTGSVTFQAAETNQIISIPIIGDTTSEEHETFSVVLSNQSTGFIGDSEGVGTILNNDYIPPVITSPLMADTFEGRAFTYQITAINTPTSYGISAAPPGMTVDANTGEIEWTPATTGEFTVVISASTPVGTDSETLSVSVEEATINAAVDASFAFTDGSPPWFLQTTTTHDGIDAAESGDINDNESSFFELSIPTDDDARLTFWWKVSSESNYDYLQVLYNGNVLQEISGETDWQPVTVDLTGAATHTIRWNYSKDGSVSTGFDAGWVDEVNLLPPDPIPIFTSVDTADGTLNEAFSYAVAATRSPTYSAETLPDGLSIDPVSGVISGIPTTSGSSTNRITATNAEGSRAQDLIIRISILVAEATDMNAPLTLSSTTGEALWFGQRETSHDGIDAAQSGDINNSESTSFEVDVTTTDETAIRFWWKVSSESTYDFLQFYLNDTLVTQISGEQDWEHVSTNLAANTAHNFRWRYIKDSSVSTGADAGWVDEISLGPLIPVPIITSDENAFGMVNAEFTHTVTATESPTFSAANLPLGLAIDPATGIISGIPTNAGISTATITATNEFGSSTQELTIEISEPAELIVSGTNPEIPSPSRSFSILGVGMDSVNEVFIGDESATFTPVSDTEILVEAPAEAGIYAIRLTGTLGTASLDNVLFAEIFEEWFAAEVPEATSPGLPMEDEDNDGLANLLEFAFGGDPTSPDLPSMLPHIVRHNNDLVLRFPRLRYRLNYDVQTSTTLVDPTWVTEATNPGTVGGMVEVILDWSAEASELKFARIRVTE